MVALLVAAGLVTAVSAPPVAAAPPAAEQREELPPDVSEAADIPSAKASARVHGRRVEALSERTESSSTWVNPDGSRTSEVNAAPVRVRRGDAWLPVDLTLSRGEDGAVRAAAHPRGLELAAGGGRADEVRDLAVTRFGETEVALQWRGRLPEPRLEGAVATYPEVQPGVDLVVRATRVGFEQQLIVKRALGEALSVEFPLRGDGVELRTDEHGNTELVTPDGTSVGAIPAPSMWDAQVDERFGGPAEVRPVPHEVDQRRGQGPALRLTVGQEYFDDPARRYPVTVDPSFTVGTSFDTFTQSNILNTDQSGMTELRIGTYDGGSTKARSYVHFDMTPFRGAEVYSSTMWLYQFHAYSCAARDWEVWSTPLVGTGTRWANQPAPWTHFNTMSETRKPGCALPDGWSGVNTQALAQAWADQWFGMAGVMLKAANENDTNGWKKFYSADSGAVPHIDITYNFRPNPATGLTVSDRGDHAGVTYTRTTTPTLSYTPTDPDGDQLYPTFFVYDGDAIVASQQVGPVPSGSVATWQVPPGVLQAGKTYRYRVTAHDGHEWGGDAFVAIRNKMGGRAIDVNGCSTAPSVQLILWDYWGGECQRWAPMTDNIGHWAFTGRGSRMAIDVANCGTANGTLVTQWHYGGVGNWCQTYAMQPSATPGYYKLVSRHAGKPLDPIGCTGALGSHLGIWDAYASDCQEWSLELAPDPGVTVQWVNFTVDTTAPGAPFVASADYPNDNTWHKGAGQAGNFTFTPPAGTTDTAAFVWGLDATPITEVAATAATTAPITPATDGAHVLNVRTKDRAGNLSAITSYAFHVGRAGLVQPAEGARVVSRLKLQVQGEQVFTHVKFAWRRGPGALTEADVPTGNLTKADGSPLGTGFVPIGGAGGLGGFAVWNVADTMGPAGGVVQVKAVLATDSTGAGAYSTVWRTAIADPNAEGAAGTQVGPGGVNLLTGDYGVSVTDVEEFGLEVSRTSSSRDTKTGYQLQRERLTTNQQKVSTDTAGFAQVTSSIARVTDRGHDSTDALAVSAPATGPWGTDTHAAIEADMGGLRLGMQPGRTYRLTAWIYVPAATGLSPPDGRGLKVVGFTKTPAGYQEQQSIRPWTTDAWQQLVVDLAVPADATEAFFRLYNGFAIGSGKTVYFDDLSVKEVVTPFGPSWETGASAASAGIDYKGLTFPHPDEVQVDLVAGGSIWFTRAADGRYWPEPGAEALALTFDAALQVYRLAELDGTVTVFGKPAGAETYVVQTVTPPVAASTTRYSYELVADQLRVKRVIAPTEPGVGDCLAVTPARGCEALEYDYASTTTATSSTLGDYARQVRSIGIWSTDPATGVMSKIDVATYRYDHLGRLREVWDPRLSPPLKTLYSYDNDGRVTSLTPAGELPWSFDHGTAASDPNAGRLLKVRRAALQPGTPDQLDGEIASTVVYGVPLTRAAGGPHDLNATAIAGWAQTDAPTDATALFGPEDPVTVHTASSSTPGQNGYGAATVHYLNASGQAVNVATPGGHIDTTEYDRFGNVVRSLESANRALALGQGPNAVQHLASLGLAQDDSATRATKLDSRTTYSADGLDALETLGPLHRIALANDPTQLVNARTHTVNTYDQGKPDGTNYHLVTTSQTGAQVVGMTGDQEIRVSTSEYTPVIGGTSGWTLKQPTRVTVGVEPGSTALSTVIRYDDQGRARESRKVDATGTDAGTTLSVFYTAGANPEDAACGNRPEWAGQPCTTRSAGNVTGHDPARMATDLPVKRVEAYSRFGEASRTVETAAGQTRTTVITHDAADRITNTETTGLGTAVPSTITEYDPVTGDATVTRFPSGGTVQRQFDKLGRLTRYTDADGAWTASTFDRYGKPATVTDSLGTTQTFTYNRALEPRGLLTSVTDSVAGATTASYGPDGQITGMDLPGGVRLTVTLDPSGAPTQRAYTRISNGTLIASSAAVHNVHGQAVQHAGPASTKTFAYDTLGRLTRTTDVSVAAGVCAVRTYTFDRRTNRTGKTTRTGAGGGACPADTDPPTSTETATYDSADRLTTAGHTYDAFGRITAGPGGITNAFFVNDMVREQTLGTDRKTWTLDPANRLRTFESKQFVNGAWASAITKVNHYGDDSDEPRWIAEDTTLPSNVTRMVSSPEGDLAATTGLTGGVELQLTSLQGSVMATVPVVGGVLGAVTVLDADEYGIPSTDTPAAATKRYAWLGGKQRSAEALGGVILMGARLYHPGTGRFWSVDSEPGGNASAYDYCLGDPVNCTDLDGRWPSWRSVVGAVAKGAEFASWIPGPIGAGAAAISAGAYAATGNYRKAAEMTVVAAANLVGAGAAVKAGIKAAKTVARQAVKPAARAPKVARAAQASCKSQNSFDPQTRVLMADGSAKKIGEIQVGDLVWATAPGTGETSAEPVLDVISGYGQKHLVELDLDTDTPGVLTATAEHPIWTVDRGWIDAKDIKVGDRALSHAVGEPLVEAVVDRGRRTGAMVFNLTIAHAHTFHVLVDGHAILVHNSACNLNAIGPGGKTAGLYVIHFTNGKKYVGISHDMHKRIHRHITSSRGAVRRENLKVSDIARVQYHATGANRATLRRLEKRVMKLYGGPTRGVGTLYNRAW